VSHYLNTVSTIVTLGVSQLLLLGGLQMLKGFQYCLYQLVPVGNELQDLRVGLVVSIATFAIAVVPCVHHLRGFRKDRMRYWAWIEDPTICLGKCRCCQFYYYYYIKKKMWSWTRCQSNPMTHTGTHTQSNQSSVTIQMMTNNTLLHSGKRDLTKTETILRVAIYR
jgi:hypothetical protein